MRYLKKVKVNAGKIANLTIPEEFEVSMEGQAIVRATIFIKAGSQKEAEDIAKKRKNVRWKEVIVKSLKVSATPAAS